MALFARVSGFLFAAFMLLDLATPGHGEPPFGSTRIAPAAVVLATRAVCAWDE